MSEERRSIGRAAAEAGVKVQTLHYYERRGLIRPARTVSGYRLFPLATIQRVRAIKRAQELAFTLREIEELMRLSRSRRGSSRVAAAAREKIRQIDEKIAALAGVRDRLQDLLGRCRCGGDLLRCDVLGGLAGSPGGLANGDDSKRGDHRDD